MSFPRTEGGSNQEALVIKWNRTKQRGVITVLLSLLQRVDKVVAALGSLPMLVGSV